METEGADVRKTANIVSTVYWALDTCLMLFLYA